MIKALELPLETNIGPLCLYLEQQGLLRKVVELEGQQQLWTDGDSEATAVRDAYARYREDQSFRDHVHAMARSGQQVRANARRSLFSWKDSPVVLALLLSLALTGLITGFGESPLHRYFLMVDYYGTPLRSLGFFRDALWQALAAGELWRLLAPAWLHWGLTHFLFNALSLWIFGRALESWLGRWSFLVLVLVAAVISNLSQFMVSGPLFGGFSGVVYALVGAHLAGLQRAPQLRIWMPPALVGFAIVALLIGLTGVSELGGVQLANAAHLGGFITGYLWMRLALAKRGVTVAT